MNRLAVLLVVLLLATRLSAFSDASSQFIDYCTQVEAKKLGIPFGIAERLRYSESSNERYARAYEPETHSWSLGWWGLNTRWEHDFSIRFNAGRPIDPYDPIVSTRVALRLLASLYWQTGDWQRAVYAYKGQSGELAWKVAGYVVTGIPWEGMAK